MNNTEILSWVEWEKYSTLEEKAILNLNELTVPIEYMQIWKDISMPVQYNKARRHGLDRNATMACFEQLIKRPYFLTLLAEQHQCKNIAEIGTAEGLQLYTFAHHLLDKGGHVWSCDLRDVRTGTYVEKYNKNTTFCLGNSLDMSNMIVSENEKIDFFYVDASHKKGEVLADVENVKKVQSENPIWVFDDFDERFGCFDDIRSLCSINNNFKVYRVGNAASGNPNHQVIIFGKL